MLDLTHVPVVVEVFVKQQTGTDLHVGWYGDLFDLTNPAYALSFIFIIYLYFPLHLQITLRT